uniref:Uncharacterized protein n=1 Tax=Candidatus Kentrum sp. UNK TaxID=2126344 RepID=A0A450ZXA8_9GAMM|nr:MAG: hypothetical protein BECKUNK1418G_GA0071005_100311 [Candidatus Kentron sp. UNK]VFK68859.1 MAG: hypothetical protein BECKUNK1418H_GA0071006_100712 [Candidatus Kentron sp. UNK]
MLALRAKVERGWASIPAPVPQNENFARAIPGSAKQRIEKNIIFSILQNQILITFDFGGASLCHEILHFVQKSQNFIFPIRTYGFE